MFGFFKKKKETFDIDCFKVRIGPRPFATEKQVTKEYKRIFDGKKGKEVSYQNIPFCEELLGTSLWGMSHPEDMEEYLEDQGLRDFLAYYKESGKYLSWLHRRGGTPFRSSIVNLCAYRRLKDSKVLAISEDGGHSYWPEIRNAVENNLQKVMWDDIYKVIRSEGLEEYYECPECGGSWYLTHILMGHSLEDCCGIKVEVPDKVKHVWDTYQKEIEEKLARLVYEQ